MATSPPLNAAQEPLPRWQSWFRAFRHNLLDADHLAWADKYLPWRYAFGCLCLAAAAAGFCGLYAHSNAYALLAGILLVLAVGTAWPWISTRGLSGTAGFDRLRIQEGETAGVRLTLRNWLPLGSWGLRIHGGLGRDDAAVSLAVVPGWRQTLFTWEFTPACRGVYPRGKPSLGTGFPFGLWEARRPLTAEGFLLVWPATFPLVGIPEMTSSSRSREGVVPQNRAGNNGDVLGVRPYRRGDPRRRIHWRQTARHDRLIVCEQQAAANPRVQLVLDAHSAAHAGARPDGSLEWAIRIVASLADAPTRQGVAVEAIWSDQVFTAATGVRQRVKLFDSLARLEDSALPLAALLAQPACRHFTEGLQLVVTTDRGLADSPEVTRLRLPRYVVLRTASFGAKDSPTIPIHPWIVIDEPSRIPEQFRRGWREVQCAN